MLVSIRCAASTPESDVTCTRVSVPSGRTFSGTSLPSVTKGVDLAEIVTGYSMTASLKSTAAYRSRSAAAEAHWVRRHAKPGVAASMVTAIPNTASDRSSIFPHTSGPRNDVFPKVTSLKVATLPKVAPLKLATPLKLASSNPATPSIVAPSNQALPPITAPSSRTSPSIVTRVKTASPPICAPSNRAVPIRGRCVAGSVTAVSSSRSSSPVSGVPRWSRSPPGSKSAR